MSDESQSRIAQLTKTVGLLEKALKDERASKKALELKLDQTDQHRYDSYKELIAALEQANNRQVQLKVLSNLASRHTEANSTAELLTSFLVEIAQLLEGSSVFLFDFKETDQAIAYRLNHQQHILEKLSKQRLNIAEMIAVIDQDSNTWQRVSFELPKENSCHRFFQHEQQIVFHYNRLKQRKNIIVLDLPHYCYTKELKQTLNTAGQQFVSAIQKRSTEEKLALNFEKLQRTLHKLTSMQKQLVHSEKMASIGQLSAGIAHEINNPIGYVKSNLQVLSEYIALYNQALEKAEAHIPEDDELAFAQSDIGSLIDSCMNGVERVADIVSSLNSFVRKEEGNQFVEVALNEVIDDSLKIAWNNIKYNCEIEVILDDSLPVILGHKGELQQVLINLIVNAVHSIEEQGNILIQSWYDGKVHVKVQDNGCGMDERTKNKLFEPFYTTKPEGKGTGLGLSVSYAIIEHHQGEVIVTSTLGEGTIFELVFPVADQALLL